MDVVEELRSYQPTSDEEMAAVDCLLELATAGSPFRRDLPLHLTGSALIIDASSGRLLLHWHVGLGRWLQLGGHGDPGETSAYAVALRETKEESGLAEVAPLAGPMPSIAQVVIVEVPRRGRQAAHRHGDVRFLFSTSQPEKIRPESQAAALRWCSPAEARELVEGADLLELIERAESAFAGR